MSVAQDPITQVAVPSMAESVTLAEDKSLGPGGLGQEASAEREPPAPAQPPPNADESLILTGKKLWLVFGSMMAAVFLVALDQTILATALPVIASDFNAFSQQGWVSSAFILAQIPFLLVFAQVLRIWPAKWVLISAVTVFEVGSAICGASQGVYLLIFGRALAGVGGAGIFISMLQVTAQITKLESRPKLFGMFSVVFGLSSVIGPLVGGALTDKVTWRWCFYINLPIGAVTLVAITFFLKSAPPLGSDPAKQNLRSRLWQTARMDWIGGTLVLGAVTSLVLGLQWGGNTKPWSSPAVIVTLVLGIALFPVVVGLENWLGDRAMVPPAVFRGGFKAAFSVVSIILFGFFTRATLMFYTYFVPIYYQVSRDYTATKSGVALLPFMLATVVTSFSGGQIVARIHRYWPFLVMGPAFTALGAGLMYTANQTTPAANVIGYQILLGIGAGMTTQNPLLAMQAEFRHRPHLIGQASGMASFGQMIGGTIGLAVAEAAFASQLSSNLARFAPTVDPTVVEESPTNVWTAIPTDQITSVIKAYCNALDVVFLLGVPFALLSLALAFAIKNDSLKPPKQLKQDDEENAASAEVDEKAAALNEIGDEK